MDNFEYTDKIIGCAITVHRELGPGLMEFTYEQCLAHELHGCGMSFELQKPLPVSYKGVRLDCGYRVDILVQNQIIIELKSVDQLLPIPKAQILTYMRLSGIKVGLLINFNEVRLKDGLKRFVY